MSSSSPIDVGMRVLVIEDSPPVAQLLRTVLEAWRCDVRVAGDGIEGLEEARAFLPEVVICDIGLPRLDGHGVARALRADPAHDRVYAIALTASATTEDRQASEAAGFDLHLAKPITLRVLREALAAVGDPAVRSRRSDPGPPRRATSARLPPSDR